MNSLGWDEAWDITAVCSHTNHTPMRKRWKMYRAVQQILPDLCHIKEINERFCGICLQDSREKMTHKDGAIGYGQIAMAPCALRLYSVNGVWRYSRIIKEDL